MMPQRFVLGFINHLLRQESWALARLRPFAGQRLRIEFGPDGGWNFVVAGDGSLAAADSGAPPEVTIRLPDDAPLRLFADRESLFSAARISGAADLAEVFGFVARNLQWDIEADLAPHLGDIAARRLVLGGRQLVAAGKEGLRRLGDNVAEYVVHEASIAVGSDEVDSRRQQLAALNDALEQLERRIAALESGR